MKTAVNTQSTSTIDQAREDERATKYVIIVAAIGLAFVICSIAWRDLRPIRPGQVWSHEGHVWDIGVIVPDHEDYVLRVDGDMAVVVEGYGDFKIRREPKKYFHYWRSFENNDVSFSAWKQKATADEQARTAERY